MLIDTHCHLYVEEFNSDLEDVIKCAISAGVSRFYLPAIDSETTTQMLKLESQYPGICFPMMGLHPCSVKANYKVEIDLVNDWLTKRKFSAIGEIGLDFYWDKTFVKEQYEIFNEQILLSIQHDLPIVIHTREAMEETIQVINGYKGKVRGIFHCFGGSLDDAHRIIEMGFYLGIGGVVTYKKSGLPEVLSKIDLKNIVLETDSPYLTPVPFRGKRNESSYLKYIRDKIAEIKNISPEEVADITSKNALKIFS